MPDQEWPTRRLSVAGLLLDEVNPRLATNAQRRAQREIVQYLFEHEDAIEVAQSIARNGYFQNEGLLATMEDGHYVVVEGNRRLAALKALHEPEILEGRFRASVQRLLRERGPITIPRSVPVTLAPDRASTDRQIAVRHAGTPVRRWRPENKASFILAKLEGGYDAPTLTTAFGFSATEIRDAKEIRALATLARSLDLSPELRAQLESPDPQIISTLHRFVDSPPGRAALQMERDESDVFRIRASKTRFLRGFKRLVTDVLTGEQDSRKLNRHEDIESYTRSWDTEEQVPRGRSSLAIGDLVSTDAAPHVDPTPVPKRERTKTVDPYVLPRSFTVKFFSAPRLVGIRKELVGLKRDDYPNAGAVLLRVFFELMVRDYLERTGEMTGIVSRLREAKALRPHGQADMSQLLGELPRIAKERLERAEAEAITRALRNSKWLEDFNAFIHRPSDIPTASDLFAFWTRMQPLFHLMLETPIKVEPK